MQQQVQEFLSGSTFAVVGASNNRQKYGNRVLRFYQRTGRDVTPVNPNADQVEGIPAVASLSDLAEVPWGISIVTQPAVTESVVAEAIRLGIRHIWMQPGAENRAAVRRCERAGVNVLHNGPCILVDAE